MLQWSKYYPYSQTMTQSSDYKELTTIPPHALHYTFHTQPLPNKLGNNNRSNSFIRILETILTDNYIFVGRNWYIYLGICKNEKLN